jgi:hypothetical protein
MGMLLIIIAAFVVIAYVVRGPGGAALAARRLQRVAGWTAVGVPATLLLLGILATGDKESGMSNGLLVLSFISAMALPAIYVAVRMGIWAFGALLAPAQDREEESLQIAAERSIELDGTYDRNRWDALVKYDPDIANVASEVAPFGRKWLDELARSYLALNDKRYLSAIRDKILADAQHEVAIERQSA